MQPGHGEGARDSGGVMDVQSRSDFPEEPGRNAGEAGRCRSCGRSAESDAVFCPHCGTRLLTPPASDTVDPTRPFGAESQRPVSCGSCGVPLPRDAAFCAACGAPVASVRAGQTIAERPASPRTIYCWSCGAAIKPQAEICVTCGVRVQSPGFPGSRPIPPGYSHRSRLVAGLLGILLGAFGVHRFYLGSPGIGVLQIVVTIVTFGIGALWGFIEGIIIIAGGDWRDGDGKPLMKTYTI